jgi:flagellar motor switch protein FliM
MAASPQTIPLLRAEAETANLEALEPLASKLARGMQAVVDSRGAAGIDVTAGTANAARFPEWRIAQNPFGALLRFDISSSNDELLVHLPGYLLSQIVDIHYGGCGTVPARTEFTAAETQLSGRIGERFAALLEAAAMGPARFIGAHTELLQAGWSKTRDAVAILPFTCAGAAIKPAVISMILSAETARGLSQHSAGDPASEAPADAAWTEQMRAAAMRVRLPARAILTRTDISFQRLLTLAPGDVLPLLLPAQIPLTVAGHIFAHGSLGDANGRAALLIEKMEKEMDQ